MRDTLLEVNNLSFSCKKRSLLEDFSFSLQEHQILALVGPEGNCGHLLLKLLIGENLQGTKSGNIKWASPFRVGYVSKHVDFPSELSIFEQLRLVLKFVGIRSQTQLGESIEGVLRAVYLWGDVKGILHQSVKRLSHFQKQKLNLARSLILNPKVLLLEDPTQLLGPIQIVEYEHIIEKLKPSMSTIWWTSDLEQAARASDATCVIVDNKMIEFGITKEIFTTPKEAVTENFITRRIYI